MNGFQEVWSIRHDLAPLLDSRAWDAGLGVLGLAFLIGLTVLPRLRLRRFHDTQLMRLLAGVVLLGPLTLLIGQLPGALARGRAAYFLTLALIGFFSFILVFFRARARNRNRPLSLESSPESHSAFRTPHSAFQIFGWLVIALLLGGRLLPAFCPPLGYDTLEYHQGIIPHVLQEGRYRPIPRVFYTAQPQTAEALYTLASVMEGTPWGFAPGVMHWLLIVLAVATAARALERLGIAPAWRPWLLLMFLEHPLVLRLQIERMSDWFGVLMMAGGVWTTLLFQKLRNPQSAIRNPLSMRVWPHAIPIVLPGALLGFFIGGALGSKWTHAGTVAVPLLFISIARFRPACILRTLLAALIGFAVWLPWGAWLWGVRGNPFAPFMAGVFPSPDWGPDNLAFLLQAHDPLRPLQARYWQNLLQRLTVDFPGPPLVALGAAAVLALVLLRARAARFGPRARTLPGAAHGFAMRLAAGLAIALLLWGMLAQSADRFLAPVMLGATFIIALALRGMLRVLEARLPAGAARLAGPALLAVFAAVNLNNIYLNYSAFARSGMLGAMAAHATGAMDRYDYLYWCYHDEVRVIRATNALPAGSRILALNDARRYLYTGRIDVASVFDESPIAPVLRGAPDAEAVRLELIKRGYTHVLFNGFEQVRILKMQTPPPLRADAAFAEWLKPPAAPGADENEAAQARWRADRALALRYRGFTESPVNPLPPEKREIYSKFLDLMQSRAASIIPPRTETPSAPAFFLAPLE